MKFVPCLLLVTLSCLGTLGQAPRQKQGSTGEEFHFQTGGRDSCTMRPSSLGQGAREVWLRVDCQNTDQTYWCEYRGQPSMCQAFAADPPTAKPTQPGPRPGGNEEAKKEAWEHCWKPFQALCAFLISFFRG
uniref:Fibroblast growth factor binding protein 2 n=1 Tax=Nomascus leucogenys TaxID=61853 RepID=A0A2I3G6F5_NOMLE